MEKKGKEAQSERRLRGMKFLANHHQSKKGHIMG